MSSGTSNKKTGRAAAMRAWMKDAPGAFTTAQLCTALGILDAAGRDLVRRDIHDFLSRGEIKRAPDKRIRRQNTGRYRYVHTWRKMRKAAPLKTKILKAMRLISFHGPFAVTDVLSFSGAPDRSHIDKLLKRLIDQGYVERVGQRRRLCSHGLEDLFKVIDTNRFRIEVMR
jgi:predicted transcriptional regulator